MNGINQRAWRRSVPRWLLLYTCVLMHVCGGKDSGMERHQQWTRLESVGENLWDGAEHYPNGWSSLPWFGYFCEEEQDWIYHLEHGYQYCLGADTTSISIYDMGLESWIWTSSGMYPYIYKYGENPGWHLYLKGGTFGNRWFWRSMDAEYVHESEINAIWVPAGFSLIPAGTFDMGDPFAEGQFNETPVHEVYVSDFFLQQTEVTNEQIVDVMNWAIDQGYVTATVSAVSNLEGDQRTLLNLESDYCQISLRGTQLVTDSGKEKYPCGEVTWYGAMAYCNFLTRKEGGLTEAVDFSDWSFDIQATGYRLPTEAEWEKAARGGNVGWRFPFGNEINPTRANYEASMSGTTEVGSYPKSGYDLYDMTGNVWEWCADWHDDDYYAVSPSSNPTGPATGTLHSARGGVWMGHDFFCRVAYRGRSGLGITLYYVGFRPARTVHPE